MAGPLDAARPVALLADLPALRGESFDVEELAGGLTNRNYQVRTVSGNRYVARFGGAHIDLLGIDRDAEAQNSRAAADIGVGPGVADYDRKHGILLVDWIDARTFTDADLDDAANLTRGDGTVACHNDLLAANMMDDGDRVRFIDYEYSGNNDACFELGNIWSEANLLEDRLEHLVTSYYGAPSRAQTVRARLWGLMSKYGWTLWAAIQDAVGQVEFDFWQWGMEKYTRAVAEFRSPDFDELIRTVIESTTHEGAETWPR